MDREAGIAAYKAMISADEHKVLRAKGLPTEHIYSAAKGDIPILNLVVTRVEKLTDAVTLYEFSDPNGC